MTRLRTAATATIAASAVGAGLYAFAGPAIAAEKERDFFVSGSEVSFQVESSGTRRYDVDVDIDDARPGSQWRIIIRHNGKAYFNQVRRADNEGDIDIDTFRPNNRKADVFIVTVDPLESAVKRSATLTMR